MKEGFRNRGVGGMLLDALIARATKSGKKIYLKTKMRNPALKLYSNKGFTVKRARGETLTLVFSKPS